MNSWNDDALDALNAHVSTLPEIKIFTFLEMLLSARNYFGLCCENAHLAHHAPSRRWHRALVSPEHAP